MLAAVVKGRGARGGTLVGLRRKDSSRKSVPERCSIPNSEMNVTNDEETAVNTVEKLEITSTDCRVCLQKCNEVWELFDRTAEDLPRKLMACAAVQVRS